MPSPPGALASRGPSPPGVLASQRLYEQDLPLAKTTPPSGTNNEPSVNMSVPKSRPFSPRLLDDLLTFCASNAGRRPEAAYLRPGDVVWRLPLHRFPTLGEVPWLRLWFDAHGVAGYAWFEPPTGVELDLRSDLPWSGETGNAMLDWAEAMRSQAEASPRQLIHEGFRRLAAKGMTTAHTETPAFNTPAQALYESSGFERAGKRWTFMKEINAPDATMTRRRCPKPLAAPRFWDPVLNSSNSAAPRGGGHSFPKESLIKCLWRGLPPTEKREDAFLDSPPRGE